MKIKSLDHLVLTVADINVTVDFYSSVMGMNREVFGEGRVALKFGDQKFNLHEYKKEFEPKAKSPLPGSADICLLVDGDIQVAMKEVASKGVEIIEGIVSRTGANGKISSFYLRDPDGNLIEVSSYGLTNKE